MPTYEYECEACGHAFELFQPIGSAPRKTCPECKKRRVRRLIGSGAGIIFKGSGFYETDYRSKDYQERAKKDAESGTKKSESDSKSSKAPKSSAESGGSKSDGSKSKKTPGS